MNKYTVKIKSQRAEIIIDAESHDFKDSTLTLSHGNGQSVYTQVESYSYIEIPESNEDKINRLEKELKNVSEKNEKTENDFRKANQCLGEIMLKLNSVEFGKRKEIIEFCHELAEKTYQQGVFFYSGDF